MVKKLSPKHPPLQNVAFRLPMFVDKGDDDIWYAVSPLFRGCATQGETRDELVSNIEEVSQMYFSMYKEGEREILAGRRLLSIPYTKHGRIARDFLKNTPEDIDQKMIRLA